MMLRRPIAIAVLWIPACVHGEHAIRGVGPDASIPHFAADDPRVETAGFVRETLRLHRERGDVRHTLMAFAVGDTVTFGAMVRGSFAGTVRWQVGARVLSFELDTDASLRDVPVRVDGEAERTGQGASFRGTSWVNVDVPLDWIDGATPLQLRFDPVRGEPLVLPDAGHHYRARLQRAASD